MNVTKLKTSRDYIAVEQRDLDLEEALREAYAVNGPVVSIIAEFRERLEAEAAELRAERDALLQKPIDLAKMDSIDDEAAPRMIAYYWWQQAQEARAAIAGETGTAGT